VAHVLVVGGPMPPGDPEPVDDDGLRNAGRLGDRPRGNHLLGQVARGRRDVRCRRHQDPDASVSARAAAGWPEAGAPASDPASGIPSARYTSVIIWSKTSVGTSLVSPHR